MGDSMLGVGDKTDLRKEDPVRTFLPYLEGLRGFASLWVALVHSWMAATEMRPSVLGETPFANQILFLLHMPVGIFIVISGYVLGLPVARRDQTFAGGIVTFAKRRARRMLPAYYAALALSIPISVFVTHTYGDSLTPKLFVLSVASHLAMVQNFPSYAVYSIDPSMWSIAVECDIYVLFPLMLVPIARRFGLAPMVAAGFAVGLVPTVLGAFHHEFENYRFATSCFWYLGLFALGYAAATLNISWQRSPTHKLAHWPWGRIALVFAVLMIVSGELAKPKINPWSNGTYWLSDAFLGLALASQFAADAKARRLGRVTWFERFFLVRPILFLGTFSYSFYLIHLPIIYLVGSFGRPTWSNAQISALLAVGLVVAIASAYLFYLAFERPFLTAYRLRGDAEIVGSGSLRGVSERGSSDAAPAGAAK